jgi:hypothetical protein
MARRRRKLGRNRKRGPEATADEQGIVITGLIFIAFLTAYGLYAATHPKPTSL